MSKKRLLFCSGIFLWHSILGKQAGAREGEKKVMGGVRFQASNLPPCVARLVDIKRRNVVDHTTQHK